MQAMLEIGKMLFLPAGTFLAWLLYGLSGSTDRERAVLLQGIGIGATLTVALCLLSKF